MHRSSWPELLFSRCYHGGSRLNLDGLLPSARITHFIGSTGEGDAAVANERSEEDAAAKPNEQI